MNNKIDEIIFDLKKEFTIFLIKNNLYLEFKNLIKNNLSEIIKKTFLEKIEDIELKKYASKILIELRKIN